MYFCDIGYFCTFISYFIFCGPLSCFFFVCLVKVVAVLSLQNISSWFHWSLLFFKILYFLSDLHYFLLSSTLDMFVVFSNSVIYFFSFYLFFFYFTAWWPSYTYMYAFFSHIIMLHYNWGDIAPSATQQDLIANPFWRQ